MAVLIFVYEKKVWGGQEMGEEGGAGVVNEVGSGGTGLIINKSDSFFLGGRVFQGVGNFTECRRLTTMDSMYHYGTLMVTTIKSKSYQTARELNT